MRLSPNLRASVAGVVEHVADTYTITQKRAQEVLEATLCYGVLRNDIIEQIETIIDFDLEDFDDLQSVRTSNESLDAA